MRVGGVGWEFGEGREGNGDGLWATSFEIGGSGAAVRRRPVIRPIPEERSRSELSGTNGRWRRVMSVPQKVLQFHSLVRLAATLPLLSSAPLPVPLATAFAGVPGARLSPLAAASILSSFHFAYMPQQCPHPL